MKTFEGYMAGVNLGGWISQFKEATKEHFEVLKESDIKQIASWGMDHVRLPIDYMVLEEDENPFQYKEEGFAYIDRCIGWCEANQLNIILDLHRAAGYAFHSLNENKLFEDEILQRRFIKLWQEFARRYRHYGSNVVFELLNEIVEPDSSRWNKLSQRVVKAIREIDQDRIIIIGGNNYNSVFTLQELEELQDDKLVYTFHFYEPHLFTHQKASWEPEMKELDMVVAYPSGRELYEYYLQKSEDFKKRYSCEESFDRAYLKNCLEPALKFREQREVPLYCGEYGVIDHAPIESNLLWHKDLCELLIEYGIGRAVWTYKLMSFPMVDENSQVRDARLIETVSKK